MVFDNVKGNMLLYCKNTNEIPGELSHKNTTFSHWTAKRFYTVGYFQGQLSRSEMDINMICVEKLPMTTKSQQIVSS